MLTFRVNLQIQGEVIMTNYEKYQLELNREWLYLNGDDNNDGEPYGERNFVVPHDFVLEIYEVNYSENYSNFEDFLDCYEPETVGEFIYQSACAKNLILDESICFNDELGRKFISGSRAFTKDDFYFQDEVIQTDTMLNFYTVWNCNVDEIFGTNVETTENSDYIDVYVMFNLDTGTVEPELRIHLSKESDDERDYLYYFMSDREIEIVTNKMGEYLIKQGDAIEEPCPHCLQLMWYQTLLYNNSKWKGTCNHCGKSYDKLPQNYSPILQRLFDYSRLQKINLTKYCAVVSYKCNSNQEHFNTLSSCSKCSKVGCHIMSAASDAELVLNNEKTLEELDVYWTHPDKAFTTEDEVDAIKAEYPLGTIVKLISMKDPYAPVSTGTTGEIVSIDSIGSLHMKWTCGTSLALIVGVDKFEVISKPQDYLDKKGMLHIDEQPAN